MDIKDLILASSNAKEMVINALMEFVKDNGEEMNEYFYNELGMDEEDEDGVKIIKVLDISNPGCYFATQDETNDDRLPDHTDYSEEDVNAVFTHYAIWSLYVVREEDGTERLKYYQFYNDGIVYEDSSEPDHDYVSNLSLAELCYIVGSVELWSRSVHKQNKAK